MWGPKEEDEDSSAERDTWQVGSLGERKWCTVFSIICYGVMMHGA